MIKYRVKPGDTLWSICRRFDISIEELLEANPEIVNPHTPLDGSVLKIPV